MIIRLLIFVLVLALAACASITSKPDAGAGDPTALPQGNYLLPRTIFNVKVTKDNTGSQITIQKSVEADPQAKFIYNMGLSVLSDDDITVKTDDSGLLSSITSNTTDETGNIAVAIASLVFTTATGAPVPTDLRALPDSLTSVSFAASYDPLSSAEAWRVRKALISANYCVLVGGEALQSADAICRDTQSPPPPTPVAMPDSNEHSGIYYRRPMPTQIAIYKRSDTNQPWSLLWIGSDQLFDKTELYALAIDRRAFVKNEYDLTFTNGVPSQVHVIKPSEALALTNTAVKIAQIITALPLQGIKSDQGLVDAQTALIKSQTDYINAQQNLMQLQLNQAATSGRSLTIPTTGPDNGRLLQTPFPSESAIRNCQTTTGQSGDACVAFLKNQGR